MSLEELSAFLARFASFEIGWLPTSWTSEAVWGALRGEVTPSAFVLAFTSLLALWSVAALAAFAYREGWIRSLDSGAPKLDPVPRPASLLERTLHRFGQAGAVVAKDTKLLLRDPTQWSQLLVLVALAGVYLVSVSSLTVDGLDNQRFRDAPRHNEPPFYGLLARRRRRAHDLPEREFGGRRLLAPQNRTGERAAHRDEQVWYTLPVMLTLGVGLGGAAAFLLDMSPTLAWASPVAGLCAALAVTGLGVGLGAAFPRFNATTPSEIPMAAGGLLYMTLSLAFTLLMTVILAYPAWQTLKNPNLMVWTTFEGLLVLALLALTTLLSTALPLLYGSYRLSRYEPG